MCISNDNDTMDLAEFLSRFCNDPTKVGAVAEELTRNPPSEEDPVLCVHFTPQLALQPNRPSNPVQTIVAALSNPHNGGVNLCGHDFTFSFASLRRMVECRAMLSNPADPNNQCWAFYPGPLVVAWLGVGVVHPTAKTHLITGIIGNRVATSPFAFFQQ